MIICKASGQYHPTAVLCSFLSQKHQTNNLTKQLQKSSASRHDTPKTFPVEFKAACSPPIYRDESRDKCDRAVLEALSRANQKAAREGTALIPFSKHLGYYKQTNSVVGNMEAAKRAGHDLAEQFIQNYPESFKIRFSDKLSLGKITYIQELCREKRIKKAHLIFKEIKSGQVCKHLEDKKLDLDALLDLFAFYNFCNVHVSRPISYNRAKLSYEYKDAKGFKDLPYTKSLLKTVDVEARNVTLVKRDLLSKDELSKEERASLLKGDAVAGKTSSTKHELRLLSERITDPKDKNFGFENEALLPKHNDGLSVSIMNEKALALEVFQYMADEGLITAPNYDSVIQSAVKFYRPDLALQYYDDMRGAELHPSTQTISDLIYSITHNMDPEQFAETGALQIARILEDLSDNPSAQVNDGMFLHLFYGVHMYEDPSPQSVQAVNKYNYHILREMEACVKSGIFKIKFSTAYKILELNNLSVADQPKSCFAQDLIVAVYDLYDQYPDYFIRDLETDDSIKFLPLLIDMSRRYHHDYSTEEFYLRHLDDIKALIDSWHSSSHTLGAHVSRLITLLRFDLYTDNGSKLESAKYSTLEEVKKASVWDLYRDCFKPNLEVAPVEDVISIITNMYIMLSCLDPFKAQVDYVIGKYRNIMDEFVSMDQLCVKSVGRTGGSTTKTGDTNREELVKLYVSLETFFNRLRVDYLEHFSIENETDKKLTMSQDNMLDVIYIATSCITMLLEKEAVPIKAMVDVLLTYILKSGEHHTAWRMLELYHTYEIELETAMLLTFVQLSPEWETQSQQYLESVPEPMQTIIKDRIEQLEEQAEKTVDALSRDDRFIPRNNPFGATDGISEYSRTFNQGE